MFHGFYYLSSSLYHLYRYRSYGKFAQSVVRNNNQIEYLTDPEELRKLIKSPNIRINYCHLINVSKNFATFIIG
jgi:hypothetical protein